MNDLSKRLSANQIAIIEEVTGCKVDDVSNNEAFNTLLEYEGIVRYDQWIRNAISSIYGIELD